MRIAAKITGIEALEKDLKKALEQAKADAVELGAKQAVKDGGVTEKGSLFPLRDDWTTKKRVK